jgi:ankyrin repeat protein
VPTHTALIYAALKGPVELVWQLLRAGADSTGTTALMLAAKQGEVASVRALLKAGADVMAKDRLGRSALTLATDERVKNLLEATEKMVAEKAGNTTAIAAAAKTGSAVELQPLFGDGADAGPLAACERLNESALLAAADHTHPRRLGDIRASGVAFTTTMIFGARVESIFRHHCGACMQPSQTRRCGNQCPVTEESLYPLAL